MHKNMLNRSKIDSENLEKNTMGELYVSFFFSLYLSFVMYEWNNSKIAHLMLNYTAFINKYRIQQKIHLH